MQNGNKPTAKRAGKGKEPTVLTWDHPHVSLAFFLRSAAILLCHFKLQAIGL